MANIATDRGGKVLFSASYGGNEVALNPLQANGVVAEPKQVIPTGLNAHAFLPSPDNRFVYVSNELSGTVTALALDANAGTLKELDSVSMLPPDTKLNEGRWLAAPYIHNRTGDGVLLFTPDATRQEADNIAFGLNNVAKKIEAQSKWW